MNLWVRSQDKMKLLPNPKLAITIYGDVENGYSFDIYDTSAYNQEVNLRYAYLGTYETKERALEVLDEIQNILTPKLIFKQCDGYIENIDNNLHIVNPKYETTEQLNGTYVYQMPKE